MRRAVLLALPFLFVAAATASANGRFPQSNEIAFHPRDPLTIYARTTFGILVSHDGGDSWRWICEPALELGPAEDPPVGILGDGHILVSLFVGQKLGTPDGCNFDFAAPDFDHVYTIDNVIDGSNPDRAYVITSQGGGHPNQPWRTDDDGAHWTPLGVPIPDVLFETIDVATSDPMRVYMTGAMPPTSTTPRQPFVYHSTDGGVHFDVYPFALGAHDQNIYIAGVDPTNADRLYVRVSGDARTSPISPDRLVVSDDGGMSFHDVIDFPSMFGFAQSDDGQNVWVGGPGVGIFQSTDRGEHFTNVNSMIQVHCLAARGTELWACGNDFTDYFAVGVSHDGGMSFEGKVRLKTIAGPVECSEGTTCAQCTCQWCNLATMFDPTTDCTLTAPFCPQRDAGVPIDAAPMPNDGGTDIDAPGSEPTPPPGGGTCCSVAGARSTLPLAPLGALALTVLWRRRRPRH